MSNCSACQGEVLRKDKFCGHCGSSIDPPGQEEVANESTPGSRATLKLIAVAVATLAAAALIALVVIVTNNSSQRGRHVAAPPAATPDSVATNDSTPPSTAGVGSTSSGSTPASLAPPSFVGQTTLPPTTQPVEPPTTSYIPPTTIPMVSFGPNAIPGMTVEAAESTLNGLGFQTVVQQVDPSQCAGIHVDRVQAVAQPGSTYEDTSTYFYGQAPQGSTIALWVCQ